MCIHTLYRSGIEFGYGRFLCEAECLFGLVQQSLSFLLDFYKRMKV